MKWMLVAVIVLALLYFGTIVYLFVGLKYGILHVDRTDPDKDKYHLEVTKDLDKITKHKRIIFEVSQEKPLL